MKLTQVKEFNKWALDKEKYILVFTLGAGSMLDEPRRRGWIVSGYKSEDSHKFFSNKQEAENFIIKIKK